MHGEHKVINIWEKVLTKAVRADKKWTGFWQISLYTPPRTPRISGLKSQILRPTFLSLNMMVKSGLVFLF